MCKLINTKKVMKSFRLKVKKFLEEEAAEEYNGDTIGMYIGGTIGTLMMVAMILMGGMQNGFHDYKY